MCNLYRLNTPVEDVARMFRAEAEAGINFAAEVYPGYRGLVIEGGRARAMSWGFPRVLKGKSGQPLKPRPVNNARDDKLGTAFWRDSFEKRRCLIPVSAWAEAEGESGRMTRTWYSLPDAAQAGEPFAVAGLWRPTQEWGDAYTMVMTDACAAMIDVHDRMPVLLARADWECWQHGAMDEAFALVHKCDLELLVERSAERWAGGTRSAESQPTLL